MKSHLMMAGLLALGVLLAGCKNAAPPSEAQKSTETVIPEKTAADLMRRAEQGDAEAQHKLGVAYYNGEGLPKDLSKALEWSQKAAAQGNAEAQVYLGVMYAKGEGVPKDAAIAVGWFQKAAAQGLAEAQYNLGQMYYEGEGVPKDAAKAVEWYQKAATQGDAEAQYNLGAMYGKGEGVPKFLAKAFEWCQKAAVQGLTEAQYILGAMYASGEGVRKDNVLAYAWSNLAASRGEEKSVELRGTVESVMSPNEIAEAQRLSSAWKPGQILSREAGTASPRSSPLAQSGKPWQMEGNWDRVRQGMSESQVISILGRPTRVEDMSFLGRTLFYKGEVLGSGIVSGNVEISEDDRVRLINKPVF